VRESDLTALLAEIDDVLAALAGAAQGAGAAALPAPVRAES
jgi:hypothetical protein